MSYARNPQDHWQFFRYVASLTILVKHDQTVCRSGSSSNQASWSLFGVKPRQGKDFWNCPLQSWIKQHFSQTFQQLFSKIKSERKSPRGWGVVKCWEFERKHPLKWIVSISRLYWVYLDITWKSSKNWEFWAKVPRIETFLITLTKKQKFVPAIGVRIECVSLCSEMYCSIILKRP